MDKVTDDIALVPQGTTSHEVVIVDSGGRKKKTKIVRKYKSTNVCFVQVIAFCILLLIIILACVSFETWRTSNLLHKIHPHSPEDEKYHRKLVEDVNNANLGWKARYNPWASRAIPDTSSDSDAGKSMMDKLRELEEDNHENLLEDTVDHVKLLLRTNITLPSSFDVRDRWNECWAVHQIFNQAGCGSCWSVAATSVMSDRLCIATNGTIQSQISALDLTSCCASCGGCQGTHWALSAFSYWKSMGLVSGGSYGSHEGCRPYSLEPDCGSPCASSFYLKERTPTCERKCQPSFAKNYDDDITQSSSAYWLRATHGNAEMTPIVGTTLDELVLGKQRERPSRNESIGKSLVQIALRNYDKLRNSTRKEQLGKALDQLSIGYRDESHIPSKEEKRKYTELIQKELYLYGPVLACFTLHEDFQQYHSGVYTTDEDRSEQLYGHCAKLLGWGEEKGTKFWLYSNTWGRDWGENGFFRLAFDEVPEEVVAGKF